MSDEAKEVPGPSKLSRLSRRGRMLAARLGLSNPSANREIFRIPSGRGFRYEPKTSFTEIVKRGPARFERNPPIRFVCDGEWSALPISFTLMENDDEHFVYEVSWPADFKENASSITKRYHLYYWKKSSPIQIQMNEEMKFPKNARWCDTMVSSRTGGDFNYIRRVLLNIGINIGITITETTRRKSGM